MILFYIPNLSNKKWLRAGYPTLLPVWLGGGGRIWPMLRPADTSFLSSSTRQNKIVLLAVYTNSINLFICLRSLIFSRCIPSIEQCNQFLTSHRQHLLYSQHKQPHTAAHPNNSKSVYRKLASHRTLSLFVFNNFWKFKP